ncbi:hypothetical protein A2154_03530 [Candidatus Gottesmanbacteria bacterium RBG_16_43_7]|uniref:SCP domain-containing protein n=1 Tax=Candidatus Gottesmanbacteria bacterium RBG_16_43_7 TaxID=1798373 RepID=A0A1F5Z874_9BACT|nr:MAG: hypothetical protein A2154_03530 [Candidatus Gottesmanbacteria bacterium RBG_16_43_7]
MSGYHENRNMFDLLRHLFLPHHTNNHRPKSIHIDALFVYVLFFVLIHALVGIVARTSPGVLGYATDIFADQLLAFTNTKRAENGLSNLTMNNQLSQAAVLKAQDMFAKNYWAHASPEGKTPWDFINSTGYTYIVAGENLAKNFSDSAGVVEAWMASPTHRDNVLKAQYQDVGFAIVNGILEGEETTLVVQMFGSSSSQVAQLPQLTPTPKLLVQYMPSPTPIVIAPAVAREKSVEVPQTQTPSEVTTVGEPQTQTRTSTVLAPARVFAADAFGGLSQTPLIDRTMLTKYIAFIFIALMLVILIIDAVIASKRKIVRISGHNLAHIMFFVAIILILVIATPGSVLYE